MEKEKQYGCPHCGSQEIAEQAIVPVEYTGVLPDLFREGQGIIAHGTMSANGAFVADEVLAKHDEKYMPPEVAASLKNKPAAGKTLTAPTT